MIALSVSDSGGGMDEDTLSRAFEPFFTTKMTGKGTGLGLSQVYGFASQSGGDVRIASAAGKGTTVTLLLPCSGAPRERRAGEEAGGRRRGRTGRILLVEDNDEVGEFAEAAARSSSATRSAASAPARRRSRLRAGGELRPGLHRRRHARDERPRARRRGSPSCSPACRSSSPPAIATRSPRSGAGGRPVILKPYRPETLAAAIDQALAPPQ